MAGRGGQDAVASGLRGAHAPERRVPVRLHLQALVRVLFSFAASQSKFRTGCMAKYFTLMRTGEFKTTWTK